MYTFLTVLQMAANLCIVALTAYLVYGWWRSRQPGRKVKARAAHLGTIPVYQKEEEAVTPRQEARRNFEFLGIPSVDAGGHVLNVPTFNPAQEEGWEKDREVYTTARATVYTRQGVGHVD